MMGEPGFPLDRKVNTVESWRKENEPQRHPSGSGQVVEKFKAAPSDMRKKEFGVGGSCKEKNATVENPSAGISPQGVGQTPNHGVPGPTPRGLVSYAAGGWPE